MARRSGFLAARAKARRDAEKQRMVQMRAQEQAQTRAAKAAEKARKDYQKAEQKERAKLYTESRIADVDLQNEQLENDIAQLGNLLTESLSIDDFIDFAMLKQAPNIPPFNPGQLAMAEPPPPPLHMYLPPDLSGMQKFIPGAKEKHTQEVAKAHERYRADTQVHAAREFSRQQNLAHAWTMYQRQVTEERQKVGAQHAEIDTFQQEFFAGSPSAITEYFTVVLASSPYPNSFPQHAKLAYVPESKQLVVEYDLPTLDIIPLVGPYKYVKAKDEVTETARPLTQRKALYSSVIAQVTLRSLKELFKADRRGHLETIVFNGYVSTIDKGTGRPIRICLVTVRTSRDTW